MQKRRVLWLFPLILLAGLLLLAFWLEGEQQTLAQDVLRLHVLANSDSQEDQALKLQVRDAVLARAEECLSGVTNMEAAQQTLSGQLEVLQQAGAQAVHGAGYDYPVTVTLEDTWFPTKQYEGFALPSGTYRALRVVIGEGRGQNWWCVVFPPLCLGAVSQPVEVTAAMAGMSAEEIGLMVGEEDGYVVKFKLMELWDELKSHFAE